MKNLRETRTGKFELFDGEEPCTCPFQVPLMTQSSVLRQRCGSYCPLFKVISNDHSQTVLLGCSHSEYALTVNIKFKKP